MGSQNSKSGGVHQTTASTSSTSEESSESGPITIEIRGQRLSIRSDRDPAFVRQLARHIDSTFEQLHSSAPTAPMNKLLLLTGMTVAEELFETREELEQMQRQLEETTETMFELIDQVEEL